MTDPAEITDREIIDFLTVEVMGWQEGGDGWYKGDGVYVCGPFDFDPILDANDRDMLVDQMRELGWYCFTHNDGPAPDIHVAIFDNYATMGIDWRAHADTPGKALCLAAVKAIQAMKENEDEH